MFYVLYLKPLHVLDTGVLWVFVVFSIHLVHLSPPLLTFHATWSSVYPKAGMTQTNPYLVDTSCIHSIAVHSAPSTRALFGNKYATVPYGFYRRGHSSTILCFIACICQTSISYSQVVWATNNLVQGDLRHRMQSANTVRWYNRGNRDKCQRTFEAFPQPLCAHLFLDKVESTWICYRLFVWNNIKSD